MPPLFSGLGVLDSCLGDVSCGARVVDDGGGGGGGGENVAAVGWTGELRVLDTLFEELALDVYDGLFGIERRGSTGGLEMS